MIESNGTIDAVHKSINQKTSEIGCFYGSKCWKKSSVTEALIKVIDFIYLQN